MNPGRVLSRDYPAATAENAVVRLHLLSQPEAAEYDTAATWEEYANGDYRTSTVRKQMALGVRQVGDGYEVDFQTQAPELAKNDDVQPLEQVALRLAALYERVVVGTSPTGQFLDVLNHAHMQRTWEGLKTELREATAEDDAVTGAIVEALDKQLEDPANVLRSLQHDYAYETLVKNIYNESFAPNRAYRQTRKFSRFFADLDLWFVETLEVVAPTAAAANVALTFRGKLDSAQTDADAVGRAVAAALGADPADPSAPDATSAGPAPAKANGATAPAAPRFGYEAAYEVDRHTGLPVAIDLTVYCRLADTYNKQYSLNIRRR